MASYYIVENNQQVGPFTIDQLMAKGITSNTNVWTVGMSNWVTAGEVPELQAVLNSQAQQSSGWQQPTNQYYEPMPENHKSKAIWSLVLTIISMFCCANCFGIIGVVFSVLSLVAANRVNTDYLIGNMYGAIQSSNDANKWGNWAITSLILGMIISIIGWTLYYFLVFAAAMADSSYY